MLKVKILHYLIPLFILLLNIFLIQSFEVNTEFNLYQIHIIYCTLFTQQLTNHQVGKLNFKEISIYSLLGMDRFYFLLY